MAIRAAWALLAILGLASPALGQDCRLALVLTLDVSGSVDPIEDRLQREGLAQALLAPDVVQAFLRDEPVALFVFEWASISYQADLTPDWQIVESKEDLVRIAATYARAEGRTTRVAGPMPGVPQSVWRCCMPQQH